MRDGAVEDFKKFRIGVKLALEILQRALLVVAGTELVGGPEELGISRSILAATMRVEITGTGRIEARRG
jgi:hypothetical protein